MNNLNNFDSPSNHPWYVLRCLSGKEFILENIINDNINNYNLSYHISKVIVINENNLVKRNGKYYTVNKSKFPGYIYINAIFSNEVINFLKKGFIDPKTGNKLHVNFLNNSRDISRILPLRKDELMNLGLFANKATSKEVASSTFKINERVKIVSGPFLNYEGLLKSYDDSSKSATILISIFKRPQNITIPLEALRKV